MGGISLKALSVSIIFNFENAALEKLIESALVHIPCLFFSPLKHGHDTAQLTSGNPATSGWTALSLCSSKQSFEEEE